MGCENPIQIIHPETKELIMVPCRKCILCRQKRCRDWAIKLINEAKYYKKMCMITLTFSPNFLLKGLWAKVTKFKRIKIEHEDGYVEQKQVSYKEKTLISPKYITDVKMTKWLVTRFMKKLRKYFAKNNIFISYFAAGEHGTQRTHRAHWHILIFGISKEDLLSVIQGKSKKDKEIYVSPIIIKLWSYKKIGIGKHTISDVNSRTIKYTANYTLKKMYKEKNENSNSIIYNTAFMFSNQNKIGYKWIRRYPYSICNGFLEDEDGGKYSVPEGYKKELLRYDYDSYLSEDCQDMLEAYSIYETNMFLKLKDVDKRKLKENSIRKAKRLEYLTSLMERDAEF